MMYKVITIDIYL